MGYRPDDLLQILVVARRVKDAAADAVLPKPRPDQHLLADELLAVLRKHFLQLRKREMRKRLEFPIHPVFVRKDILALANDDRPDEIVVLISVLQSRLDKIVRPSSGTILPFLSPDQAVLNVFLVERRERRMFDNVKEVEDRLRFALLLQ